MSAILGVAGAPGAVEFYAVDCTRQVTLHGFFRQGDVMAVVWGLPRCLIAVDDGALPPEVVVWLRDNGHSVMVINSTAPVEPHRRRRAKEVCEVALGIAQETIPYHNPSN